MTPEERAERMVPIARAYARQDILAHELVKAIAAEIQAAVEEGQQFYYDNITLNAIRKAKAEAYEDAAKIAGTHLKCMQNLQYSCAKDIAEKIRARAAEVSK